jgi:hypothetical protein
MSLQQDFAGVLRRAVRGTIVAVAAAVALGAGASEARADEWKDAKLGYSINPPRKWTKRPIATSERFIVAKWESEREYEDRDPKSWDGETHRPSLDVVVIPLALATQKGGTVSTDPDGKAKLRLAAPFTDLKGWLEKTLPEKEDTGFYFSKEEEAQVGGTKVMQYEVTMEKVLDTWHRPKRVYAWAWYGSDAIYGAVADTLLKCEGDLKPDILAALKSVKIFPRTGVLPGAEHTGEDVVVTEDPSKDNSTDVDRERRRRDSFGRQLKQLQDARGAGWTTKESANFTAVSHADAKFTKTVLDHAEALRGWLDKNLGYIGNGYAGKIVIQICKDRDERDAERKTGGFWSADGCVVTTYKDTEGFSSWSWQDELNNGIWGIWRDDKNDQLWKMPDWLSSGLRSLIGTATSKGSKIEFRPSLWDKEALAVQRREGKLQPAQPYFTKTQAELWKDYEVARQGEYFVRFLAVGGAQRNPKFKNVLSDYLKNTVFLIDEANQAKKPEEKKPEDEPKSEKEEEEMLRKQRESWSSNEKAFLDKIYERTFPGWTPADWEKMTQAYWKDLE